MGLKRWLGLGRDAGPAAPIDEFRSSHYLRHNARRLEHLASLGLPIEGRTVLEVGAGIGDHTPFYLDRGCRVTVTEAREGNLQILRERFADVHALDMERPALDAGPFDICHCYGLLYHLADPRVAIAFMAEKTSGMLLLETCVSFGDEPAVNPVSEPKLAPSQAVSGQGCRPTRPWVVQELRRHFPYVYTTTTQPDHEEFPLDWTRPAGHKGLARAVFIASRAPLVNALLASDLPPIQTRSVPAARVEPART